MGSDLTRDLSIGAIRLRTVAIQCASKDLAGVGFLYSSNLLGSSLGDDASAFFATFRAEIDDPVGLFDDVKMMFDDQDGVAERNQAIQHAH